MRHGFSEFLTAKPGDRHQGARHHWICLCLWLVRREGYSCEASQKIVGSDTGANELASAAAITSAS